MKLATIHIQDGENSYYEYYKIADEETPKEEDYADGFLRAVKSINTQKITEAEIKVLEKFGVI